MEEAQAEDDWAAQAMGYLCDIQAQGKEPSLDIGESG